MNIRQIVRDEVGWLCRENRCNDNFLDNLDGAQPLFTALEEFVADAIHGPTAQVSFGDYVKYMQTSAKRIEKLSKEL